MLPDYKGSNTMGQERPMAAEVEKKHQKGRPLIVVAVVGLAVDVCVAVVAVVAYYWWWGWWYGSSVYESLWRCAHPHLGIVSAAT